MKTTDNLNLFTKNYLIESAKANILIVHGLHEHCLRYQHVAAELNKIGLNVYTFDLRGHGQSEGPRVNVKSVDEYRNDLEIIYGQIPKNIPFFILGHSMGGLIVADFVLAKKRPEIKGVVLSGAALEIGEDISPILIKMASLIGTWFPNLPTQKLNAEYISRDKAEVEKYMNDPLNYIGGMKAGLGLAVLNRIREIQPKFKELEYPILIMHGAADKITNPKGSQMLYNEATSKNKTLKYWDGALHEIFNETNKNEVIEYTKNWLEKQLN